MSDFDLAAIEARLNAATPSPWTVERHAPTLSRLVVSADHCLTIDFGYVGNRTQDDAEFVAHAPDDIRALLATIARVREVERWFRRNYPGLTHVAGRLAVALDQPAPAAATQATEGSCSAATPETEPNNHVYLSTGCLHGEHGYCQSHTGLAGAKAPAQCKFCAAACVCLCHQQPDREVYDEHADHSYQDMLDKALSPATVTALRKRLAAGDLPTATVAASDGTDEICGAPPPKGWKGDCWCTRPPIHTGQHHCEPCTERHGAPGWDDA